MCEELDIQLNEIPDWNCCAAAAGVAGGGELPRLTLPARNIALSEEHNPGQEIVATCATCWLSTREAAERLDRGHQGDQVGADRSEVAAPLVGTGLLDCEARIRGSLRIPPLP